MWRKFPCEYLIHQSLKAVCDYCGAEVIQRADDSEETVKNRLSVYNKQTNH
ncbi:MAG: hypothetical protein KatS3mg079_415 [Caloramator sp.]|nr:MAG: hypothetical protein KatS3mg079_415 [Caloramator sp.]